MDALFLRYQTIRNQNNNLRIQTAPANQESTKANGIFSPENTVPEVKQRTESINDSDGLLLYNSDSEKETFSETFDDAISNQNSQSIANNGFPTGVKRQNTKKLKYK